MKSKKLKKKILEIFGKIWKKLQEILDSNFSIKTKKKASIAN